MLAESAHGSSLTRTLPMDRALAMPAFPDLAESDAKALLPWILGDPDRTASR